MIAETWHPYPFYADYIVSNYGRIQNIKNGRFRKIPRVQRGASGTRGMARISTQVKYGETKRLTVARIVLEAFTGTIPKGMVCRHIDGNPNNNHLINLCLGTQKENVHDAIRHGTFQKGEKNGSVKLNEVQVVNIRRKFIPYRYSQRKLAREFGVGLTTIQNILWRRTWKHL